MIMGQRADPSPRAGGAKGPSDDGEGRRSRVARRRGWSRVVVAGTMHAALDARTQKMRGAYFVCGLIATTRALRVPVVQPRATVACLASSARSLEPLLLGIDALIADTTLSGEGAARLVIDGSSAEPLSEADANELSSRLVSFAAAQAPLENMLSSLSTESLGIRSGPPSDPEVRRGRAECLLGLYLLHVEGTDNVPSMPAGRLEMLAAAGSAGDKLLAKLGAGLGAGFLGLANAMPWGREAYSPDKFKEELDERGYRIERDE